MIFNTFSLTQNVFPKGPVVPSACQVHLYGDTSKPWLSRSLGVTFWIVEFSQIIGNKLFRCHFVIVFIEEYFSQVSNAFSYILRFYRINVNPSKGCYEPQWYTEGIRAAVWCELDDCSLRFSPI